MLSRAVLAGALSLASLAGCGEKTASTDKTGTSPAISPGADPWGDKPEPPPAGTPAADPWGNNTPSAPAEPIAPPTHDGTSPVEGEWHCAFQSTYWSGGSVYIQPLTMPGFTISGTTYSAQKGGGTVEAMEEYVEFHGGAFDGWRGAMNRRDDGRSYIEFAGEDHRQAVPNHGKHSGEVTCDRR